MMLIILYDVLYDVVFTANRQLTSAFSTNLSPLGIGFFVALKLIACAQNDIPFDIDSLDEVLVKELTPPMFDMETPKLKSAGSTLMGLGYLVGRPIAPDQPKAMIVKFTPYPEHSFIGSISMMAIGQRDGSGKCDRPTESR